MKKDLFIKVLEYGHKNPRGFTYADLMEELKLEGGEKQIIDTLFHCSYTNEYTRNSGKPPKETPFLVVELKPGYQNHYDNRVLYILTLEAKFKYIDYLELVEAMKNARRATYIAIAAMIISIITGIISIYYNKAEYKKSAIIEKTQFNTFQSISDKMDSLITNTRPVKVKK